jgi:hypothetical protein
MTESRYRIGVLIVVGLLVALAMGAAAIMPTVRGEPSSVSSGEQAAARARESSPIYLGFDRNDYPGDAALGALRKTFDFSGYWLNAPPGESSTTWKGKREILSEHGFGFLVLFNGRLDRELRTIQKTGDAARLGATDAKKAVSAARAEGFPPDTIIFVDQEEGGRMLPEQREYLYAWIDGVNASGYRAGVYCSGMPDRTDQGVVTADDIREHANGRKISFFVYNDACPPSPGCVSSAQRLNPARSGVSFANIWQIAQSPRRKNLTARCKATYAADGNCYPPELAGQGIFVDVDVATSADPSRGR